MTRRKSAMMQDRQRPISNFKSEISNFEISNPKSSRSHRQHQHLKFQTSNLKSRLPASDLDSLFMRAGDHGRGRDLTQFASGGGTGFHRGLHGRDITGKRNGHQTIAHAVLPYILHVGGLECGIRGFDGGN
jgi:hypothetical protein